MAEPKTIEPTRPNGGTPQVATEAPEEADSRKMDPELLVIRRLLAMLADLPDESARMRVMVYLNGRFLPGAKMTIQTSRED